MRGYLDNDVLPALGDKLPTEITRRDCADLQERIEARGALNTRDKIRVAGPYQPRLRGEIARSDEPTGVLAKGYGISDETVRKWRKRGIEPREALGRVTTAPAARSDWPGAPQRKSAPLSASSADQRASASMI